MKRLTALLLCLLLLLPACVSQGEAYQKFQYYFFGTFDTIITVIGYEKDEATFQTYAALAENQMRRYHEIFDQYNAYDGVNNLYLVNQQAASAPTPVEPELMDLLLLVRDWHEQYGNVTNPAMGAVLSLWHEARQGGTALPDEAKLQAAALHTNYSQVILNEEEKTVFFEDPVLQLDLGAVAKGYAAQLTANALRAAGFNSFILNAGGNVICGDAPLDGRTEWTVAVENVDGFSVRHKIGVVNLSVVTSGDYQRYYEVDGKRYHHLIDPKTLYPATHVRSVSILYPDSGLADFLSTTAFLLPYEQSRALIESIPGAEGVWLLSNGTEYWTDGFEKKIRP